MPDTVFTSWVHGTSMQVEYPNRLGSVRHVGPFTRIEGSRGQNTWLHLPVPRPVVAGDGALRVRAVLLNFNTMTDDSWVHEVVLYDGASAIAEFRNLRLTGQHPSERFEVPERPEVQWALNVTIGVQFSPDPPSLQSMWMQFVATGCEFIR